MGISSRDGWRPWDLLLFTVNKFFGDVNKSQVVVVSGDLRLVVIQVIHGVNKRS